MKLKKTRIAFSALCGILCLLSIGLWVRSYYYYDLLIVPVFQSLSVAGSSFEGELLGGYRSPAETTNRSIVQSQDLKTLDPDLIELWRRDKRKYRFGADADGWGYQYAAIPHYLVVLLFASAAVLPRWRWIMRGIRLIPHRFSLRTLLMFCTIVALILGVIIYFTRL